MPKNKKHYRITLADALSAHRRALEYGGRDGIPNINLVKSAIERPYSGYYRPIETKASALVESMAKNHGFADGNKRTTVLLLHTLLKKSGYKLEVLADDPRQDIAVENMVLDVVNHKLSFDELKTWFKNRIKREYR